MMRSVVPVVANRHGRPDPFALRDRPADCCRRHERLEWLGLHSDCRDLKGGLCADTCSGEKRMPRNAAQCRAKAGNRGQESSDCAAGAGGLGSLGAPSRPQPARPGRPGRAWTVSPGLPAQPSSKTNGRDITSSIFFSARARMPAARGGLQPPQRAPRRRKVDLYDSRLPVVMLCRPRRQNQD